MRNPELVLTASLLVVLVVSLFPGQSQAQRYQVPSIQSGSDLLAAVNSLRASRGLPAYSANSILMGIAQAQADYMAATGGAYGHNGPGGSTPKDRALAAGYPATFFSENWQAGSGLSPSGAVVAWQGDAPHLDTMLSASLLEAGAGVSKSGSVIYYVLDAGAQGSASNPGATPVAGTIVSPGTPKPSQFMVPVMINTPDLDGKIYHEVAYGQTLWSIAIAYGTKIEAIQRLNNLSGLEIFPGQKLLVLFGPTPAPVTASPSGSETPAATSASPTVSLAVTRTLIMPTLVLPTVEPSKANILPERGRFNLTALVILGAALLFAILGTWAGARKSA